MKQNIESQCKKAHHEFSNLLVLSTEQKNKILIEMAFGLENHVDYIIKENMKDILNAKKKLVEPHIIDRLSLTKERILGMANAIREVVNIDDPIGKVLKEWQQPNSLFIQKITVPIGVIGVIYEARPNVTADAIALAVKSNNCIVLRGSSSAYNSNSAIVEVLKKSGISKGLPENAIQLLSDTSRESVKTFLQMNQYLDLIIPRGSAELITTVCRHATVPTIETGAGNCHVYIDKYANIEKAIPIIINSKTHRPSVCNSAESLIIHDSIDHSDLTKIISQLEQKGVQIIGCNRICSHFPSAILASEKDWGKEFLNLTISVKLVSSLNDAIKHINFFGTKHTEVIVSENNESIEIFKLLVDASTIIVNASSRFTDGGQFGFGTEIGISTQKSHPRGPMGLPEITTYKYIVTGNGQVRT